MHPVNCFLSIQSSHKNWGTTTDSNPSSGRE